MILAVAIQKGGTGKTTTAAALAQAAASKGKSVLAIDLDPQANLTFTLGAAAGDPGSRGLLDGLPAEKLIQTTAQGIDTIPASWDLATVTTGKGSARRLQNALEPLRGQYDYIIIDTPPTAGELQYNALQAADGLIIPLQADIYNAQGLYQITDTANAIRKSNPALEILGIVFTQHNARSTIARQMADAIRRNAEQLGVPILGEIHAAVAVKEAAALQKSLFEYAPKSKPALDYMAVFEKINAR